MMRSFHYAAQTPLLLEELGPDPLVLARLDPWAERWATDVSRAFLHGYRDALAGSALRQAPGAGPGPLLDAALVEKALYELRYELDHRPHWARIPVRGLRRLCGTEP